jgi:hypothetical protein
MFFGGPNSDFKEDSNDSKEGKTKLNATFKSYKST